ncbi:MAG: hypothetical protein QXW79_03550, partial [Thermoplasmata archaeon]
GHLNALEDLKVTENDGIVVDTTDNIIQFKYGEDGIDPTRSKQGKSMDYDSIFERVLGEKYIHYKRGGK